MSQSRLSSLIRVFNNRDVDNRIANNSFWESGLLFVATVTDNKTFIMVSLSLSETKHGFVLN